jgi:hypothetical protein
MIGFESFYEKTVNFLAMGESWKLKLMFRQLLLKLSKYTKFYLLCVFLFNSSMDLPKSVLEFFILQRSVVYGKQINKVIC